MACMMGGCLQKTENSRSAKTIPSFLVHNVALMYEPILPNAPTYKIARKIPKYQNTKIPRDAGLALGLGPGLGPRAWARHSRPGGPGV